MYRRTFKIIDFEDNKIKPHSILKRNRYIFKKSPEETALKAVHRILNKTNEDQCHFAMIETTRGSKKRIYFYEGKREKLSEPRQIQLNDQIIKFYYKYSIKKVDENIH